MGNWSAFRSELGMTHCHFFAERIVIVGVEVRAFFENIPTTRLYDESDICFLLWSICIRRVILRKNVAVIKNI